MMHESSFDSYGDFGRLDEGKASLRILVTILYNQVPMTRQELIEQLGREGIGRTSFYSSHKTLKDIGLIEDVSEVRDGKRVILTQFTEKGLKVASKLVEIVQSLK